MRNADIFDALGPSVAVASLCAALAVVPDRAVQHMAWDRAAIGTGELWRLWTGHIVHYSLRHALLDAAAVLLLGCAAERLFGKRSVAIALLLCAPLMSLGLLALFPGVNEYRGASAVATLLGVLAGVAMWRQQPVQRAALLVLAAAFGAKVAGDTWQPMTLAALPPGVSVSWQAHLLGVAVALTALAVSGCLLGRQPDPEKSA